MDRETSEERDERIDITGRKTPVETEETSSTPSSDSSSRRVESRTRRKKRKPAKIELSAAKTEPWRNDPEWTWVRAHHRLASSAQVVTLGYESAARGVPPIKRRITSHGCWVWRPDVENIMRLGGLASCFGNDKKINKPFFTCGAPRTALASRPTGPPEEN